MATDAVLDFYESINFEVIDIDGYDTLFSELSEDGTYATVSDDDGRLPESLESPIVCNIYDHNDSFQWSVTLDDSYQLQALLNNADSTDALLATLSDIRQEHIETYQL